MKRIFLMVTALSMSAGVASAAIINIIGDYSTDKNPNFVGTSSVLGNGDFEAESATGAQPFSNISHWFNLTGAESVNFGQSNGTVGSPQSGSLGAQINRTALAGNDTGYTILSAGETFNFHSYLGQFGSAGNYNGDETYNAHLFTSATGVNAATDWSSDVSILGTATFSVVDFDMAKQDAFYTSALADVGKTVYLGLELVNLTTPDVFPRIDVVSLSVTVVPEPSTVALVGIAFLGLVAVRRSIIQ